MLKNVCNRPLVETIIARCPTREDGDLMKSAAQVLRTCIKNVFERYEFREADVMNSIAHVRKKMESLLSANKKKEAAALEDAMEKEMCFHGVVVPTRKSSPPKKRNRSRSPKKSPGGHPQ